MPLLRSTQKACFLAAIALLSLIVCLAIPAAGLTQSPGYLVQIGDNWRYRRGYGEASAPATSPPTPVSTNTPAATPTGTPIGPSTVAASFLVYPYLGETTPSSVTISWATETAVLGRVRACLEWVFGNAIDAASHVYDGKFWHSATISGLTADTTYTYRIYHGEDDVTPWSDASFATAPEAADTPFTAVIYGDSRPWGATQPPQQAALDVAARMQEHSFDLALHTGDLVYSGGVCTGDGSSWNQYIRGYFDVYRDILGRAPFFPSIGNHDLDDGECGYQGFTDVFALPENAPDDSKETYYSFDWAGAHLVALDIYQAYTAGSAQYNWLVNDLQTTTQPWKIVFFHKPPYSSGLHGSTMDVREHLIPVFEDHGVDIVFSGHDHHYERTCPILDDACVTTQDGGVVYYVTGGGGAPTYAVDSSWFTAYSERIYHLIRADIGACRISLQAIDRDGIVFDTYELDRCDDPTPTPTPGNPNNAPVVDAGPALTVTLPQDAVLYATVDDDGLPDPPGEVTTTWSLVGGLQTVTFADATAVNTTAHFSTTGTYVLRLTADDGALTSTDEVTVTVLGTALEAAYRCYLPILAGLTNTDEVTVTLLSAPPVNAPLVVDTGPSLTVMLPENAALDTTAGDDGPLSWSPDLWTYREAGFAQRMPDLAAVRQEIVYRSGGSNGNEIAITGTGKRVAEAYNGIPAVVPLLHVEYVSVEETVDPADNR